MAFLRKSFCQLGFMLLLCSQFSWSFHLPSTQVSLAEAATKELLTADHEIDHENPRKSNSSFPGDISGDSPFFYCPESDPENDIFAIDQVVLNPNPPHMNTIWVLHIHGFFRELIWEKDFHGAVTIKCESHDGIDNTWYIDNVCDFLDLMELDNRGTGCPAPLGTNATLHQLGFIEAGYREGNFTVKIQAWSKEKRAFCIQSWFELSSRLPGQPKHPNM